MDTHVSGRDPGINRKELLEEGPIDKTGIPTARNGEVPYFRYIVTRKGDVVLGVGCYTCHIRVLPDGTIVTGAQGNFRSLPPSALSGAELTRTLSRAFRQYTVPWLKPDPAEDVLELSRLNTKPGFNRKAFSLAPRQACSFPRKRPISSASSTENTWMQQA
jgi:hypothetical protein